MGEATKRAIRGKEGLITIHTHPNSFPPSLEDFNSNFANRNGKSIVCGHDGSVYAYEAKELIQKEKADFYYRKYYNLLKDENEAQEQMWMKIMTQARIYVRELPV